MFYLLTRNRIKTLVCFWIKYLLSDTCQYWPRKLIIDNLLKWYFFSFERNLFFSLLVVVGEVINANWPNWFTRCEVVHGCLTKVAMLIKDNNNNKTRLPTLFVIYGVFWFGVEELHFECLIRPLVTLCGWQGNKIQALCNKHSIFYLFCIMIFPRTQDSL